MAQPRRIILLSDGTGNSSSAVWRTNVWRMFDSLDLTSDEQVACYDDGVGTSTFKPLAILGGVFGYGLKRNVLSLYKFACRNFRNPGDEIYGFGFSRGAFTIRVAIGLIIDQGLLPASEITEFELDRLSEEAYGRYRSRHFHTNWKLPFVSRDEPTPEVPTGNHVPKIKFLGLWDTVAAYGLPIEELTRGVSQWIWPMEIARHTLHPSVQRACHALALDDERTTFHPVLWDESDQDPTRTGQLTRDRRISQVWFSGVHSNVGGGYAEDSLAHIPMYWIQQEARDAGLTFKTADPNALAEVKEAQDKDGRLYNSRSGAGSYYRYGPRRLSQLCSQVFSFVTKDKVQVDRPKIHESVFKRIANHAHPYAPIGIPHDYQVVRCKPINGTPNADFEVIDLPQDSISHLETQKQAEARVYGERSTIWFWVYVRGFIYLLTLATTVVFVMFPSTGRSQPLDQFNSPIFWISDLLEKIAEFAPGWVSSWLKGYAQYPWAFVLLSGALGCLMFVSSRLEQSVADDMSRLWRRSLNGNLVEHSSPPTPHPTNLRYRALKFLAEGWKIYLGPALSALLIAYVFLSVAGRFAFTAADQAGYFCSPTTKPSYLPKEGSLISFDPSNVCFRTGYRVGRLDEYYVWTNPNLEQLKKEHPDYKTDRLTCTPSEEFVSGGVRTDARGFSTFNNFEDQPIGFFQTIKYALLTPMRRYWSESWFQPILRYGSTGEEVDFLYPDPDRRVSRISEWVKPRVASEIFLYVNDAVFPFPRRWQGFYKSNSGCVSVFIMPKKPGG